MNKATAKELIPTRQRIDVGGYTFSLVTCGPQEGKPVVFLHGIPTSAELWRPMQFYFAQQGYRTFAPDLPGFGKTISPSPEKANWQDSLALIQNWIQSDSTLSDVWWIGHQAGCLLAGLCAQRLNTLSARVTSICPLMEEGSLWPTWALGWMPRSIQWGLYHQLIRSRIFPNVIQRQHLGSKLADIKKLDIYLDRKVLFNEKVHDVARRHEFVHFIKNLPSGIVQSTQQTLRALACPVQVIIPALPEPSLLKKAALKWQQLRSKPAPKTNRKLQRMEPFITDNIELITIKSGNLFSPLETPQLLAEAALIWADPALQNAYAEAAQAKMKKPAPKPVPQHEGIRINSSITLPPDGSPPEKSPLTASAK
ncbi:MAG: alpha/beta fold hydrolase [Gammaproteobacteria bacterium]